MQLEELRRLVSEVQQRRMEPDAVEVKAANHPRETPKVTDSLSVAGQELRGLVDADLVEQDGVGRWTTYSLRVAKELPEQLEPATDEDKILAFAREKGSISNSDCQALLGVDENRAYYLLKKLTEMGRLKPQGKGKGRKYLPV